MRKATNHTFALLISGIFLFSTACATQGVAVAKEKVKTAGVGSGVSFEPGFYEDKNLGFSMKYDAKSMPQITEIREDSVEVLHVATVDRVPALIVQILDIPDGIALENIADTVKAAQKRKYRNASKYKVVESKMVKLASGMDANYTMLHSRYRNGYKLQTAVVSAYKNGKMIQAYSMSIQGKPAAPEAAAIALALDVAP